MHDTVHAIISMVFSVPDYLISYLRPEEQKTLHWKEKKKIRRYANTESDHRDINGEAKRIGLVWSRAGGLRGYKIADFKKQNGHHQEQGARHITEVHWSVTGKVRIQNGIACV